MYIFEYLESKITCASLAFSINTLDQNIGSFRLLIWCSSVSRERAERVYTGKLIQNVNFANLLETAEFAQD